MTNVVHLAITSRGRVAPLCGDWRGATSWTTLPRAVSCAGCRDRIPEETSPPASRVTAELRSSPDA